MSSVVDFKAERTRRIEEAWKIYLDARERAEQTRNVVDGIAAGKAWRQWLDLFMTAEQRSMLDRAGSLSSTRRIG